MQKIKFMFRALEHRNYRLFFWGQCVSLIGTWIQQVAISWLVYSITKSALLMGVIAFSGSIPSFFISPFAGVLVDRVDKFKLLILMQSLFMFHTFVLAGLTLTGVIQVWHLVALSLLSGLINAVDMPLRQAFVVNLVNGYEDLGNAISLNSSVFNLARLLGPAFAGVLIASVGEGYCFLLNALSYIAVIFALSIMKITPEQVKTKKDNMFSQLKEGIKYTYNNFKLRRIILFIAATSFIGMSYNVLMPIFAKEILSGNSQTLGFLMSSSGIGALIGALYLASKKSTKGLLNAIILASLVFGFGILGLGFISNFWVAMSLMFLTGAGMVIIIAACNTLLQSLVDDDKRGRVMSLYTMAFMGTAPIGSLCGGAVAEKIGVEKTFILIGILIIVSALVFFFQTKFVKK